MLFETEGTIIFNVNEPSLNNSSCTVPRMPRLMLTV